MLSSDLVDSFPANEVIMENNVDSAEESLQNNSMTDDGSKVQPMEEEEEV